MKKFLVLALFSVAAVSGLQATAPVDAVKAIPASIKAHPYKTAIIVLAIAAAGGVVAFRDKLKSVVCSCSCCGSEDEAKS